MAKKILLVEDDPSFGSVLKSYLELSDYEVVHCQNGVEGYDAFVKGDFDLCLFDVMMPEMDGFTLAKKVKERNARIPLIFITAKNMKKDVLQGYEIGADDYITKPFDSEVLFYKIKALLDRCDNTEKPSLTDKIIKIGDIEYNTELRTLNVGDKSHKLTPKEADLLILLYEHREHLLPRDKALESIWGTNDYFTARSMDVYITKLRKYLKQSGVKIENIHGSGFRLIIE